MSKFDKWVSESEKQLKTIEDAMDKGYLLSKEELFDYNVKYLLSYQEDHVKVVSSKEYRVAVFYAKVLNLMNEVRSGGYTNKKAISAFKKISLMGLTYCGKFSRVWGEDWNGSLYIDFLFEGEESSAEIKNGSTLSKCMIAYASCIATSCLDDSLIQGFVENYLMNVYTSIVKGETPSPYINVGVSKTLKHYMRNSAKPKTADKQEGCKIVDFSSYGGCFNGRNESQSTAYGGV